ncbi:MAG: Uma2 family endonuclease [Chloroflexales bacterium]
MHLVNRGGEIAISLDEIQGLWTEEIYLRLTDHSNWLIEFTDGYMDFLPMPTDKHQAILRFLFRLFDALMVQTGGTAFFAALRLQIRPRMYREPDLLLLLAKDDPRRQNRFWLGADLVVEIVSPDDPERDLVEKVADYAEANIPEYWIVNPNTATISVLRLEGDAYVAHGVFGRGENATSALLPGFTVDVSAALDAE